MSISDEMREKLEAAFAPEILDIEDESERGGIKVTAFKIPVHSIKQADVPIITAQVAPIACIAFTQ